MSSSRHRAREFAIQGIYQWQLTGHDTPEIEAHLMEAGGFDKADYGLFCTLLRGALAQAPALKADIEPHLDRSFDSLSPVERSILLLATFEFKHHPETPYRVILNEAIELAKEYGGTDGHKYVNGVMDKLAALLRAPEVQQRRAAKP
jgi:N utilization substance protein B